MGSVEVSREHLLVIFYQVFSPEVERVIREKFADSEVTLYQSKPGEPVPRGMCCGCMGNELMEMY
jgi:hypothetical protein